MAILGLGLFLIRQESMSQSDKENFLHCRTSLKLIEQLDQLSGRVTFSPDPESLPASARSMGQLSTTYSSSPPSEHATHAPFTPQFEPLAEPIEKPVRPFLSWQVNEHTSVRNRNESELRQI